MAFFVLLQLPKTFLRSDSGEVIDFDEDLKFYTAFSSHCALSYGFDNMLIMEVKLVLNFSSKLYLVKNSLWNISRVMPLELPSIMQIPFTITTRLPLHFGLF